MEAHQSLISRCIGCSNAYLANIITSSKLLSDLYSQELVLKHHVVNLLVFSL